MTKTDNRAQEGKVDKRDEVKRGRGRKVIKKEEVKRE